MLFNQRPPVAVVAEALQGKVPTPRIVDGPIEGFKHEMKMLSVLPTPIAYCFFKGLMSAVVAESIQ